MMDPPSTSRYHNDWNTSCLGIFKEPFLLLTSIFCPWRVYRKAVKSFLNESVTDVEACFGGICCFCGFDLRARFRDHYSLRGTEAYDFCLHLCCNSCGLAQIYREAQILTRGNPQLPKTNKPKKDNTRQLPQSSNLPPNHPQLPQQLHQQTFPGGYPPPVPVPASRNIGMVQIVPKQIPSMSRPNHVPINENGRQPRADLRQYRDGEVTATASDLTGSFANLDNNSVAASLPSNRTGSSSQGQVKLLTMASLERFRS